MFHFSSSSFAACLLADAAGQAEVQNEVIVDTEAQMSAEEHVELSEARDRLSACITRKSHQHKVPEPDRVLRAQLKAMDTDGASALNRVQEPCPVVVQ